ncbi:MAG: hypothetical protein RIQ56_606 [Candidatus Parcubacteria bacterium]
MQVTLAFVMSVDGFLLPEDGAQSRDWASKEDQAHFQELLKKNDAVVLGSNTYDAHKNYLLPVKGLLRVVMTRNPQQYQTEEKLGVLEFSPLPVSELLAVLERRGYTKLLIAGGSALYKDFLAEKLVHDLFITIEPLLFGDGLSAATGAAMRAKLQLINTVPLNEAGTLLLHYKVLY